jgi:hypothetical protein
VRVEFSKKASTTVLPRNVASFFKGIALDFLERFGLIENE